MVNERRVSASMAEVIRLELRKGSYQMPGDTLPYETEAANIAEVLAANGYGKLEEAKAAALREAALELMNVSEADSRMPGIRFAVGFLAGHRRPE